MTMERSVGLHGLNHNGLVADNELIGNPFESIGTIPNGALNLKKSLLFMVW